MNKLKILLAATTVTLSVMVQAQNNEPEAVTLKKISENLYQVLGGNGANAGVYIGTDEVLVIDSKMDQASVDGIYDAVSRLTDKPVKYLINTHSDGDHINGNPYFPEDVTIIAHENCRKEILGTQRDGSPSTWTSEEMLPFVPEITFNDKMLLHVANEPIELHYFGVGHTTGDIVVYFPEEKTAFIGDQVFWGRPQLIHSYKGGNSFEHIETAQNILDALDAEKFCSGHSEMKTRADIEQHIAEMMVFQEKIKSLLEDGKSLSEVQAEFTDDESRLVESVYNEIQAM